MCHSEVWFLYFILFLWAIKKERKRTWKEAWKTYICNLIIFIEYFGCFMYFARLDIFHILFLQLFLFKRIFVMKETHYYSNIKCIRYAYYEVSTIAVYSLYIRNIYYFILWIFAYTSNISFSPEIFAIKQISTFCSFLCFIDKLSYLYI